MTRADLCKSSATARAATRFSTRLGFSPPAAATRLETGIVGCLDFEVVGTAHEAHSPSRVTARVAGCVALVAMVNYSCCCELVDMGLGQVMSKI
ncbi:hypothetical protein ACLB2K_040546 [Fragaria x ananassa]